jgi:hypothetical protein
MSLLPYQVAKVRSDRYAYMEKSAGSSLAILAIAAGASALVYEPSLLVVASSVLGGLGSFASRRAGLLEKESASLAWAIVAIILMMVPCYVLLSLQWWVIAAQALPWAGIGLFSGILARRNIASASGP